MQIVQNALHGPLGNPNRLGNVVRCHPRVAGNAEQDLRMVGQECPTHTIDFLDVYRKYSFHNIVPALLITSEGKDTHPSSERLHGAGPKVARHSRMICR